MTVGGKSHEGDGEGWTNNETESLSQAAGKAGVSGASGPPPRASRRRSSESATQPAISTSRPMSALRNGCSRSSLYVGRWVGDLRRLEGGKGKSA
jgi:hypothetical protein